MAKTKKSAKSIILTITLVFLIIILAIFAVFNILFFQSPIIGISMQPLYNEELEEGKTTTYYESSKIKDKAYVYRYGKVSKNSIVMVEHTSTVEDKVVKRLLVKRVIAIGGESVNIKRDPESGNFYFYINDEKLEESYIKDISRMEACYNNFNAYKIEKKGLSADEPLVLKDNELFVMGDNRGVSNDSSIFGPVKKSTVTGTVSFVVDHKENLVQYLWKKIF